MGPRSNERGNDLNEKSFFSFFAASMGPRSNERGNMVLRAIEIVENMLQWGHVQMNVEIIYGSNSDNVL